MISEVTISYKSLFCMDGDCVEGSKKQAIPVLDYGKFSVYVMPCCGITICMTPCGLVSWIVKPDNEGKPIFEADNGLIE